MNLKQFRLEMARTGAVDYQVLFNIVLGLLSAVMGWVLNTVWTELRSLQETDRKISTKVFDIEVLVAGQYVRRDEFERLAEAMFKKLDKIYDKIDGKADK